MNPTILSADGPERLTDRAEAGAGGAVDGAALADRVPSHCTNSPTSRNDARVPDSSSISSAASITNTDRE